MLAGQAILAVLRVTYSNLDFAMDPIERLEAAIELAESNQSGSVTIASTLVEIYRIMPKGFTDSEATYWAERLESLVKSQLYRYGRESAN